MEGKALRAQKFSQAPRVLAVLRLGLVNTENMANEAIKLSPSLAVKVLVGRNVFVFEFTTLNYFLTR